MSDDEDDELQTGVMTIQVIDGHVLLGVPDHLRPLVATVEMTPETAREVGEQLFKAGLAAEGKD